MSGSAVAVVGAGSIGVAWAVVFARAGHQVRVHDVDAARRDLVPREVRERADELAAHGLLADPEALASRVEVGDDLAEVVGPAVHVQECVVESEEVKRELFAVLDRVASPTAVLASSSSMMPVSRFAADLPGRDRCLVVHPGNPPYLLPVAELVPAEFTSADTVERTHALLLAAGMAPVRVEREVEGFLFNRLQGALLREAYRLVRDGVASATDVDRVVSQGLGRRWAVLGPFATADLNTRGGLTRHAELMGPAYLRMGAEHGEVEEWPAELVARVADDLHAEQHPDEWAANVLSRDRALMRVAGAVTG
ncbi:3-hydroxyacyl-CoA dehydrogenase [Nocardioides sp. Arc9.136]|uniref:3-hydroxyacyl-CoA dehydrogenase n=1 Tax=Nocardioides sp. Arc9.136 TaxID=2996826 RepID=UPI002664E78D|nr:3-hydroxyacyl-CoA dehydrogenase [Nocardioides sp. Arc9.136]WKN48495.1 3-hydroxyacyl-CoA dehydrogenase [Nocardioides sp. Arc9.136]